MSDAPRTLREKVQNVQERMQRACDDPIRSHDAGLCVSTMSVEGWIEQIEVALAAATPSGTADFETWWKTEGADLANYSMSRYTMMESAWRAAQRDRQGQE